MTATKKKQQQSKPSSGGTLMNMRSGFQKITGTGGSAKAKKTTRSKWTFQQVLFAVGGVALLVALFYAFSSR